MSVLVNLVTNPRGRPADPDAEADPLAARQALVDALAAYTDAPVQWSATEPGDTSVVWVDPATGEAREWTPARERLENLAINPQARVEGENPNMLVCSLAEREWVEAPAPSPAGVTTALQCARSSGSASKHLVTQLVYLDRPYGSEPLQRVVRVAVMVEDEGLVASTGLESVVPLTPHEWVYIEAEFEDLSAVVVMTEDSSPVEPGTRAWVTEIMSVPGGQSPGPYGDGDAPGWMWDGPPHESASHRPARDAGWWPIEDPDVQQAGQDYADAVAALAPVGWSGAGLWWSVEHDAVYVPQGTEAVPPVDGQDAPVFYTIATDSLGEFVRASTVAGGYFDGDTPDRTGDYHRYYYTWNGPPHASTSTQTTEERPGIRVEPGFHNAPFAGINVTGLDPSEPSVINLWRSVPGEPRTIVQGAREMRVTAAAFVEDWGAPLGRPVTYTLEVISGAVEPELLTDTITIDSDTAWLQDPLNPVTAVPVVGGNRVPGMRDSFLTNASFTELVRELPDELHYPIGATLGVSLGGQRRAPSRIPLTVLTQAAQEAARLRTLLETAHPIMLRTPPNVDQIPAVTYLRVEASEQPVTTFLGGEVTRWVMTADTVRGPSVSVLVPRWTYGDVQALYGTYGEVIDGRRYLDWVRDPEALGSLSARSTTMRAAGD